MTIKVPWVVSPHYLQQIKDHPTFLNIITGIFRYFFAAVTSAAILCLFVIITSIIFLVALHSDSIPIHHPFIPGLQNGTSNETSIISRSIDSPPKVCSQKGLILGLPVHRTPIEIIFRWHWLLWLRLLQFLYSLFWYFFSNSWRFI